MFYFLQGLFMFKPDFRISNFKPFLTEMQILENNHLNVSWQCIIEPGDATQEQVLGLREEIMIISSCDSAIYMLILDIGLNRFDQVANGVFCSKF